MNPDSDPEGPKHTDPTGPDPDADPEKKSRNHRLFCLMPEVAGLGAGSVLVSNGRGRPLSLSALWVQVCRDFAHVG
jgi:hypothetical protein